MKLKLAFLLLFVIASKPIYSQSLNTKKLDELFNSLEKRNEAMGSITISKNGKILYNRAIGYRYVSNDIKILADSATNYRIWSITKTYTAVMILQLAEEGELSLQTTLDNFYPNIPNSNIITIQNMLDHKSGIHDFVQNDTSEDWDTYIKEPLTHEFMVKNISQYNPDFQPGKQFQYSNSNYLLLGYIIEKLDNNLYEISLSNRISSKIGLTSTYFGVNALDTVENKAYSYQFDKQWKKFDEGDFSGLIPAGAGGIVSTTTDMSIFIEGLFTGKLISESGLKEILNIKDSYGLGIMKIPFENTYSYGHTGGYIASESSLFYYPKDSITIAYCTNGIVLRKEEILNHVLFIITSLLQFL
jgi:CubicO group peptidase (beta-lactamase class C family)